MKQSPSTELELRQAQKMAAVPKHPHHNKQHGRHAANLSEHAEWLGFSVDNMDPTTDPRQDFYRFAAGRWLDKAVIPDTDAQVGGIIGLFHRVNDQILALLQDAANSAGEAPGSIAQQVGIFFRRGDGYRAPGYADDLAVSALAFGNFGDYVASIFSGDG